MKTAIVILNWNGKKLLEQFLPSVVSHSKAAVVYVADNASTDDSVLFVRTNFPSVKIIQNRDNYGFAKGYNEALLHVEEEIYALVNSDVEVTANWLDPIISLFANDPDTAIVQPKILDFKNKEYFEYAGAGGGFIDKFGYPYCRGRIFDTLEKDEAQYNDVADIFWASGACFFIRKEVFHSLGGFDADFFAHQEEIDLCWRAFNENLVIKYCGGSTVYHVGGATLEAQNPKKTFLNFRNSLFMLTKNLPASQLFPIIFFRLVLDGIAGIQFLCKGKWKHTFAIVRAHFTFYGSIGKQYRKRKRISGKRYFATTSIVYEYFIAKKRNYKNLI